MYSVALGMIFPWLINDDIYLRPDYDLYPWTSSQCVFPLFPIAVLIFLG